MKHRIPLQGDALELLQLLPGCCTPLGLFDPKYRGVLGKLQYGVLEPQRTDRAQPRME